MITFYVILILTMFVIKLLHHK